MVTECWASQIEDADAHVTSIKVFHFRNNEEDVRKALEELNEPSLKGEESAHFIKVRLHVSRYAITSDWSTMGK